MLCLLTGAFEMDDLFSVFLLPSSGPTVAAMGLDASDSIQARNSLEKMLAHQLAVAHAVVMEQMEHVHVSEEGDASAKRLVAMARCLQAYQHGLLTLKKLHRNKGQRILVQYVNLSEGGQAMIRNVGQGSVKAYCIARHQAESTDRQSSRTRSPPSVVARTARIPRQ